jgi:hypothetical protein
MELADAEPAAGGPELLEPALHPAVRVMDQLAVYLVATGPDAHFQRIESEARPEGYPMPASRRSSGKQVENESGSVECSFVAVHRIRVT